MADQSDFKRGQIVDTCMEGASVAKNPDLFGLARSTVSKVMITFERDGKSSSLKQNSRRKREMSARDRRTLTGIFGKDHKNTTPKITVELYEHLENSVFFKNCQKITAQSRISWKVRNQKTILK